MCKTCKMYFSSDTCDLFREILMDQKVLGDIYFKDFEHFKDSMGWTSIPRRVFNHDDVIKWKHFPRYWPFVRGIHRSPVNSTHKGQWRGAFSFSLICLNGRLSKQSWGWWFETPVPPLWRHSNDNTQVWEQFAYCNPEICLKKGGGGL